jgi:hydroxymethylbilane synthase
VILRVGTRRSRLAMAQAREVASRLAAAGTRTELVPIVTAGDRGAAASDDVQGLKGLFVGEIVRALIDGRIDIAVHSAKDLPAEDTPGVVIAAVPERASPLDVLVRREAELGHGAVVGTSSVRRRAQLLRSRSHPRLAVVDVRGNVDTRLSKLDDGEVDALVLAAAGLQRLQIDRPHVATLSVGDMVPAPGQGALAVQARAGDAHVVEQLVPIEHAPSRTALAAERAVVGELGGGCALPLGALASQRNGEVHVVGLVAAPDGERVVRVEERAPTGREAGVRAARRLIELGAGEILSAISSGRGRQ